MPSDLTTAIAARRSALGLTQEQAAERAGMSRTGWINLEREDRDVRLSTLQRVAAALECVAVCDGETVRLLARYDATEPDP